MPAQVRAEVWMSLVHGSAGIGYFAHIFSPSFIEAGLLSEPAVKAGVKAINSEIASLAPVLNTPEAVAHPHLRQRGTVQKTHDPVLGEVDVPGFPIRFSASAGVLDMEAPLLGQHNAEVLKEFLDYSDERIAQLKQQGVLVESPIDVTRPQAQTKQA